MYLLQPSGCHPFGFIAHPKTASRAVREPIVAAGGSCPKGHHQICPETIKRLKANPYAVLGCTVRNPFDKMVSWYYYQEQNVMEKAGREWRSFDEWIEMIFGQNEDGGTAQRFLRRGMFYGAQYCDAFIRFEEPLTPQLNAITPEGFPHLEAGFRQDWCTNRRPYREVYTPWSRRFIQEKFADELEEFRYSY